MNILDAVQQTTRRAGGNHVRQSGTKAFEQSTKDWRTVEQPERLLRRLEQLGLKQEALTLARSMNRKSVVGFNPLERIIGQNQLMSSFFLPLGAERARAVGRIVTKTGDGLGTGFLISTRLLMTNNHVIENDRIAALCRIEFDYVCRFGRGFGATQLFRLLPGEFFLTSATHDDLLNLDYTIVAVEPVNSQGEELAGRGSIPLVSTLGDLTVLEWANIIQHPGGDPQQVALRDNKVVKSLEHFIHYEADTQPGSSGSPVFNDQWELAALHHSGVPDQERPGVYRLRNGDEWDTGQPLPYPEQLRMWAKVNWLSNEGVRINSIIADARSRLGGDPGHHALFNEAVRENASPLLEERRLHNGGSALETMIVTKPNARYEFERELGHGAFGVVKLARDRQMHSRPVVIKYLLEAEGRSFDDASFRTMFERETSALAWINHRHVVDIYDFGWAPEGKPFIVMKYIEGQTLRAAMGGRAMKPERAARIVSQLGSALSAVHDAGVVHRDLKPENVMLQSSHDDEFAILIDFGVAKIAVSRADNSEEETVAGTPVYMAPEQLRGHPVPASDVWALGIVTYELVTGRRPFSGADVNMLKDAPAVSFTEPRTLCPALPKVAQAIILKALSYDPAHRYTHAHEMGEAFLQAVLEGDLPVRECADENQSLLLPPPRNRMQIKIGIAKLGQLTAANVNGTQNQGSPTSKAGLSDRNEFEFDVGQLEAAKATLANELQDEDAEPAP